MKGLVLSLVTSLAFGLTGAASTAEAGGSHPHHHHHHYKTYRPVYPVVIYPNPYYVHPWNGGIFFPQPFYPQSYPPVIFYNRY